MALLAPPLYNWTSIASSFAELAGAIGDGVPSMAGTVLKFTVFIAFALRVMLAIQTAFFILLILERTPQRRRAFVFMALLNFTCLSFLVALLYMIPIKLGQLI